MSTTTTTADIPPTSLGRGTAGQSAPVGDEVREQGRELARSVTEHGRTLVDQTRSQLRTQADEQGRRLAGTLRSVGEDLRTMGQASDDRSPAGEIVRTLGDTAQRWAGRLEQEGVAGLGRELSTFGRNRPLVFLSTSLGLGFAAGRMARNVDTDRLREAVSPSGEPSSGAGTVSPGAMSSGSVSSGSASSGGMSAGATTSPTLGVQPGAVSSTGPLTADDPMGEEQTNGNDIAGPQ